MSDGFKTNFTEITLAMDLSLASPGFAVLAVFEGKPLLLEATYVTTKSTNTHGERLAVIAAEIGRLIGAYSPEHIVREKGFSRFPATTQALFKVVGISDYITSLEGYGTVEEIPVTTVKKEVTGKGEATKEEVAKHVFRILQIENTDEFYRTKRNGDKVLIDDKTDACSVGIAFYRKKGMI